MSDAFAKAVAAHRAGDFEAAERGYLPFAGNHLALHNLATLYSAWGRLDEAEKAFLRVLDMAPGYAPSKYGLATVLLSAGRFRDGWPLYEARRQAWPELTIPPPISCPEWDGGDPSGRRVLVWGEQGFGDELMFGRFARSLTQRGASVTFAVAPALVRALDGQDLGAIPRGRVPEVDCWAFVGSLPWRLGIEPSNIPLPLQLGSWAGGGGVGVVATGRPTHPNDANRSLSGSDAERLLAMGRDLRPEATGARDFADTAEIVAGLDLVITVDTAVAHLAASIGVPTWVLLPARATDWRWGRSAATTVWYPAVRLFRQRRHGDWRDVLDEIDAA